MTMTAMPTELLTTKQVCEVLKCHRNTVVNHIRRGELSPVRVSTRRNLFYSEEIVLFLESHTDNNAAVIRAALALMAEHHAEDKRVMCPKCSQRRVNPGGDYCTWCEEQVKLQLHHRLTWWNKNGVEAKQRQRDKAATNAQ
jgi:excisionase family DNA binding protein